MANHYTLFSFYVDLHTPEEVAWWGGFAGADEDTFKEFCTSRELDFADFAACAQFVDQWGVEPDSDVCYDVTNGSWPGFETGIEEGRVYLYTTEWGMPYRAGEVVRKFFELFRPKGTLVFGYADTCSKPRPFEFRGGAVLVTAKTVELIDAVLWAQERIKELGHD